MPCSISRCTLQEEDGWTSMTIRMTKAQSLQSPEKMRLDLEGDPSNEKPDVASVFIV